MIRNEFHFLLTMLLLFAAPQVVFGGSYSIETIPPAQDVCLYCKTDEACQSYAANSFCHRGQCTNEDGLFGLNCGCNGAHECASGRCDGMFDRTCQNKLENGEICFGPSDCISGRCSNVFLCEPSLRTEESLAVELPSGESNAVETTLNETETLIESCTACSDNSDCGGGSCVDRLCADKRGRYPPTCITCRGDDECPEGFFCNGNLNLGRTGKKCASKKVNGASCSRNEACRSGHCNVLFRCESKVADQKRPPEVSSSTVSATEEGKSGYPGLAIWASIFGALVVFGVCAALLCQQDGLERWCLGRRSRWRLNSLESNSSDFCDEHTDGSLDIEDKHTGIQ